MGEDKQIVSAAGIHQLLKTLFGRRPSSLRQGGHRRIDPTLPGGVSGSGRADAKRLGYTSIIGGQLRSAFIVVERLLGIALHPEEMADLDIEVGVVRSLLEGFKIGRFRSIKLAGLLEHVAQLHTRPEAVAKL